MPPMRTGLARTIPAALAGIALSAAVIEAASAGPAVNQFEVKDLEAEAGNLQFQSQNAYSTGQPRRRTIETAPGEYAFDDNSVTRARLAQELEVHLTDFFRMRVGLEFEKQRLDDPGTLDRANSYDSLKLSELAIEGVLILVPPKHGLGIGLIAEYQHAVSSAEADTLFMGTIVQAVQGPWSATANLFLVKTFSPLAVNEAGEAFRDNKWDFAYAAQLRYRYSQQLAFAIEGYGSLDRIANSGTPSDEALLFGRHDQHRVGPIVYYSFETGAGRLKDRFGAIKGVADDDDGPAAKGAKSGKRGDDDDPVATLGFGVLAGVTPNTPDLTYKLSLEVEF